MFKSEEEIDWESKESFDQSLRVREWVYNCLMPEDIDLDWNETETFFNSSLQSYYGQDGTRLSNLKKLKLMRDKQSSLNSELSTFSGLSSFESLFDLRRDDSEDVLYALRLMDFEEEDPIKRIPKRFFQNESQAKGIKIDDFIKAYEELSEDGFNILSNSLTNTTLGNN